MLSSVRESPPLSPLHDRTHRNSRSNTSPFMLAAQASTSELSTTILEQPPFVLSCISQTSVFYRILTAPYRHLVPALILRRNPVDPQHAEKCYQSIDWTRSHPSGETYADLDSDKTNA